MGRAPQEVISHSSANGHNASEVSRREIQPFPSSLHIANNHRIEDTFSLVLSLRLPIAERKVHSQDESEVQPDIPNAQGSFDRLLYRSMLHAESDVDYLKGRLLLEGIACALPEAPNTQLLLQPVQNSDVFELALDAIHKRRRLRREVNHESVRMEAGGMDGNAIGKTFGIGQEVHPHEIRNHPGVLEFALDVLHMQIPIFLGKDNNKREHTLNSVYKKAVELTETYEGLSRVNLAMEVAASYLGLRKLSLTTISPDKIFPRLETPVISRPLEGQAPLALKWDSPKNEAEIEEPLKDQKTGIKSRIMNALKKPFSGDRKSDQIS